MKKDVFIDEDCLTCGLGIDGIPFETVEEAEERQASGQNWIIDGGNYPINGSVIINTRIDVTTESNETVIIGNN